MTTRLPPALLQVLGVAALAVGWLACGEPAAAAQSVPSGARQALAPVMRMIGTLVAIAIGLGIALSAAVIVWGGIEKTLAGSNTDAEHRAQRRIANGIQGLVWMILAGVIVSTITAIAVAYGLIDRPF